MLYMAATSILTPTSVPHAHCPSNGIFGTPVKYSKGAYKTDGDKLLSRACCNTRRGSGLKLKEMRFRLDRRKKFFTMMVLKQWHKLPGEVVSALPLENSKSGWMEL